MTAQITLQDLLDFPRFTPDEVRLLSREEREAFIYMHVHHHRGRGTCAMAIAAEEDLRKALVDMRLAEERVARIRADHDALEAEGRARPFPGVLATPLPCGN